MLISYDYTILHYYYPLIHCVSYTHVLYPLGLLNQINLQSHTLFFIYRLRQNTSVFSCPIYGWKTPTFSVTCHTYHIKSSHLYWLDCDALSSFPLLISDMRWGGAWPLRISVMRTHDTSQRCSAGMGVLCIIHCSGGGWVSTAVACTVSGLVPLPLFCCHDV